MTDGLVIETYLEHVCLLAELYAGDTFDVSSCLDVSAIRADGQPDKFSGYAKLFSVWTLHRHLSNTTNR